MLKGKIYVKLKENELMITNFSKEDIAEKVRIINDTKNNTFLHYDLPLDYDKTLNWFNKKNNHNRLDCTITFNNHICGFLGLLNIDKLNKKAEFYICVDYNFSGNGIGYNSTKMLLDYAFNILNLNKVYLYTEVENIKAQHLFEKASFVKEGVLKDDITYNGKKVSRCIYGICKEDFYK